MRSRLAALAAVALLAASAACAADAGSPPQALGVRDGLGGHFELTDQNGQRWSTAALSGRATLVFFGYTMCADACPIAMSKIAQASRLLGDDARRMSAVFVSVDRDRDTPAVLQKYVGAFSFPLTGLTGSRGEVDGVARQFNVKYSIDKTDSAAGYLVSHTTTIFLVDGQARVRQLYSSSATGADIASGVRHVLAETH